jgi:phosphate starvation-inducible protein PhoH
MKHLKLDINERDFAYDALKNKIQIGDYVIYSVGVDNAGINLGLVTGFSKERVRVYRKHLYQKYIITEILDNYLVKMDKHQYTNIDIRPFKEMENILMLSKKMEML